MSQSAGRRPRALAVLAVLPLAGCDGQPADPQSPCAPGEILDGGSCLPASCGEAPWAGEVVSTWVSEEAADGGDGSEEAPFRTISEGMDAAAEAGGGVVAVLPGTYAESLTLGEEHEGVRVIGRCTELVQVDVVEDAPGVEVALAAEGDGASISGLRVVGGAPGVWLESGPLSLQEVVVDESIGAGVLVGSWGSRTNAVLSLERIEVRGTGFYGSRKYTEKGAGMVLLNGATLDAREVLVEDSASYGVWAFGADVELRELRVEGASGVGVAASAAAELTLTDSVITGVEDGQIEFGGLGVFVESGSTVRAERLAISDTAWYGVFLYGEYGEVEAVFEDLEIARAVGYGLFAYLGEVEVHGCELDELQPAGTGEEEFGPWGLAVWTGQMALSDCQLAVEGAQVYATEGSTLEITDSAIDGSNGREEYNACLQGTDSELRLSRTDLTCCQRNSILAEQSELSLTDVTVRASGSEGESDATGIWVPIQLSGSTLQASRLQILESRGAALLLDQGSHATVEETLIEGVHNNDVYKSALGVAVQFGSSLDASTLDLREVEGVGLFLSDATASCSDCSFKDLEFAGLLSYGSSTLSLDETRIEGVSSDDSLGGGVGVAVLGEERYDRLTPPPRLSLSNTEVASVELAAVYLEGQGSYRLRDSRLEAGTSEMTFVYPASNAIFATGGTRPWNPVAFPDTGLLLDGVELVGGDGGAIFLDGSSATLRDLTFTDVGKTLVQDRCDGVATPEGVEDIEDPELCPTYDYPLGLLDWYLYSISFETEG